MLHLEHRELYYRNNSALTAKWLRVTGVQEHFDGLLPRELGPAVGPESHRGAQGPVRPAPPGAAPCREVVVSVASISEKGAVRVDGLCKELVGADVVAPYEAAYSCRDKNENGSVTVCLQQEEAPAKKYVYGGCYGNKIHPF